MNAAHVHLASVHLPVVGILATLALLALSLWLRSDLLFKVSCGFALACAAASALAYFSGGYAYDLMKPDIDASLAESHALIGRAALLTMTLAGIVVLVALLQWLQGERPGPGLRWGLFAGLLLAAWTLSWAAHLGGRIRHPEVRGAEFFFFPSP